MKKILTLEGISILIFIGLVVYFLLIPKQTNAPMPTENQLPSSFAIESPSFENGGSIPATFTCDGNNISPELIFSGAPAGTVGLALIMEDPDVPKTARSDGMWNHWLVWDMPANTPGIGQEGTPNGVVGANTGGKFAYGGPCPPDREHRYFFTLYALDTTLDLPPTATKEELLAAMNGHILANTVLMGRYDRAR